MKTLAVLLVVCSASLTFGQATKPTVYLEPQQGFETYIAAAIAKKGVSVDVVTDKTKAVYILKSAPLEVKSESTGGKIARCLFASCAGIEDKGNVSVQLIEANSTKMVWAYSVNKQRGGSKNEQSMAEAIAKHFKEFLTSAPTIAAAPSLIPASAPTPAPVAEAPVPAPTSTPVAYHEQNNVRVESATQSTTEVTTSQDDLGDAARRTKQHKACLALAKDNPSITCN